MASAQGGLHKISVRVNFNLFCEGSTFVSWCLFVSALSLHDRLSAMLGSTVLVHTADDTNYA